MFALQIRIEVKLVHIHLDGRSLWYDDIAQFCFLKTFLSGSSVTEDFVQKLFIFNHSKCFLIVHSAFCIVLKSKEEPQLTLTNLMLSLLG